MTKPITIELLKKHKACQDQVDKFREIFGEEIVPTRELCLLHAQDFNFLWLKRFLNKSSYESFVKIWKTACDSQYKITLPAWDVYNKETAFAKKIYDSTTNQNSYENSIIAWEIYEKSVSPVRRVYDDIIFSAWKNYKEVVALAWFDAWENQ